MIRATISREPAHRSWSADPAGALSPSVAVALSTFPTNAMSPAIRFFSVNGLLSEDKLVWAAGNFRDQQQRVRPRLEAMEAGGFWLTPSRMTAIPRDGPAIKKRKGRAGAARPDQSLIDR